jgi:subtilase family serine protease
MNLGGLRAPMGLSILSLAAALALAPVAAQAAAFTAAGPAAATPAAKRVAPDPRIVDLGVASATDSRTVTVTLALRNQAALEAYVASIGDSKSANFRKFITPAQFAASYGQTPAAVAQAVSFLTAQGFTVNQVHANNLLISITGTNAQLATTFGTAMHNYSLLGETYTAATGKVALPAALSGIATGVSGLSTKTAFHTHGATIPNTGVLANDVPAVTVSADVPPPSGPGAYSVLDLAAKYNVNPLYAKGLTGAGKTIGIATLASYSHSDVFAYWNQLGITTSPTRITDVLVDGGPRPQDGPTSGGAGETTLDIEQSGGIAPGANIRVYIAPNAGNGFLDVFAQAIDENLVDVLSVSWGSPEIYNAQSDIDAFHAVFLQASAQGIPVIAAAGDAGAFDINRSYTYPDCTTLLTVDFPAADPLVVAAGGTTLPNTVQHRYGPVTVTQERPWGWDYLRDYIVTHYGNALYYSSYYTVGAGGGVSVDYALPSYQAGLTGTMTSAPAQSLLCAAAFIGAPGSAYYDLVDLPAGVAGRNLPDLSLNADPYSGYSIYFMGGWGTGSGGTSFVAPQLNGIFTLIASGLPGSGRLGPINPQLYAAFKAQGYSAGSPFKAITTGDNEYYKAAAHYNPGSGLGSLDVTALGTTLGVQ